MLAAADPYPYYRWLRETAPVHRLEESDFYLVSSWELVHDVVARGGDFSSNLTATMILSPEGVRPFGLAGLGDGSHVLATADDPVHEVHRRAVLPSLAARRIRALEPFIESTWRTLWSDSRTGGSADWVAAVANRLPMIVVARLIGLPAVDVDWLVSGAYATTQMLDGAITATQLARAVSAAGELATYLSGEFSSARSNPGDNLLGDLARLCNDGALDAGTCALMLMQLVGAGGESTSGLLGNAAWLLATHQGVAARVRGEPELVRVFIEEALRLESPFRAHYRHVRHDTKLGGVPLPAGSHLLLLWGAANRDPAAFHAPDTLRLDRPGGRGHLAFGKGTHFCVGAALARLETRVALTGLLSQTTDLHVTEPPAWVPSVTIRRLERLPLRLTRHSG